MMKQCILWILCIALLLSGAAAEEARTDAPLPELGLTFHLDNARLEALQAGTYGLLPILGGETDPYFGRVYAALLNEEDQSAIAEITTIEALLDYLEEKDLLIYCIEVVRQDEESADTRTPFATAGDFVFYCDTYASAPAGDDAVLALMQADAGAYAASPLWHGGHVGHCALYDHRLERGNGYGGNLWSGKADHGEYLGDLLHALPQ